VAVRVVVQRGALWEEHAVLGPFKRSTSIFSVKESIEESWNDGKDGWINSKIEVEAPKPSNQMLFFDEKLALDECQLKDYIGSSAMSTVRLVIKFAPKNAMNIASEPGLLKIKSRDRKTRKKENKYMDILDKKVLRTTSFSVNVKSTGDNKGNKLFCNICKVDRPEKSFNKTQRRRRANARHCNICQRKSKERKKDRYQAFLEECQSQSSLRGLRETITSNYEFFMNLNRRKRNALVRHLTQKQSEKLWLALYQWKLFKPLNMIQEVVYESQRKRYLVRCKSYRDLEEPSPVLGALIQVAFLNTAEGKMKRLSNQRNVEKYLQGTELGKKTPELLSIIASYMIRTPKPLEPFITVKLSADPEIRQTFFGKVKTFCTEDEKGNQHDVLYIATREDITKVDLATREIKTRSRSLSIEDELQLYGRNNQGVVFSPLVEHKGNEVDI